MKTLYKLLIFMLFIFVSNSIYSQITVVDAVAIDGDKNGAYGTVEIEFSIAVHDGDIKDPGDRDDWEFSLDPEFASFLTPTAFNTKVSYIAVDIDGNDEFIQFTFDTEFASSNGPIYFRYTQEGDVVWDQATESTSFLSDFSLLSASDNSSPAINNVTSNAAGVGVLKLGESIIFTVDIEGPFDETDITILPPQYNGGDLNWVTYDGGDTYTGTYIVAEGHSDRLTAWPLIDINAVDIYGNISDSLDVTNIEKTIDANTPGISSVTVVESLGSILLVDSIIEFTVTLSTAAETGLTVSPSTYNGRALNWATLDAGVTYLGEYTVTEGDLDQLVALDLLGITLSDAAGNISNSVDGNLTKGIDANTPVIVDVESVATGGSAMIVGDQITFTVDVATPDGGLTVNPASFNGENLNWSTSDGGDTYVGIYTVTEGNTNQSSPIKITGITLTDVAGNESASEDGSNISKSIDANTPGISTVTVTESLGAILLVDSIIEFTVTLSTAAETGLTVSPSTYNGRALNWATLDAGVTYLGEYTVTEGDLDQLVALDLLGITLSDVAGNISNSVDGNLTKGIDANTPVIVDVESVATGGSVMIVGDQITFTVDVVIPDGGLTVNPASFNGENLNWSTSDGGDTYVGIYTVTEGNTNQSSPIKITGITLTDAAGNESASEDGSDISKSIDANTPGISTVTVTESLGTILLVDSIIEFTVTLSTAAETGLTVSPSTYNGRALNWATPDAGVTYLGEYTVTEGDLDQLVALDLLGITLSDAAGNISNSIDGNVTKGIDANTPAITGILASTSVGGSNLTVDDEVDFELTVTDPEYGLTVSPISFNGGSLIWSTLDGATYTSTYTVAEGHAELGSVQLTGVTLSDEAGNESSTSNSNILSNDIDSKFPVISSVILKNKSKIIGDKDTLYININSDTDYSNYTFVSGTVAGYNISSIENFDNTTIYAFFDITEKTYNIDSSATVQVSNLQLSDGAGNLTNIINAAVVNDNHAIFSKKPLANISGSELICHQDSIEVPIFLNGYAPYTITYTDGFTPVTINSIASSLYKLKIFADESIGNPLTYTITDVTDATGNSNSGDGSFTLTINSLPIASFTNPTNGNNFDISQDTVDLVGNFTPEGTFFGDGVLTATEQFSPSIAGLGSHDLTYAYEDANGCNNSETITVEVIAGGNITFTQGKTVYCSYTDTFSVAGFNNFGTPGSFTFDGPIEAIENLAVDTAIIHPDSLIAGNSYNITYSYAGGTNIIRSFSVEEEVSATFDLIGAHCADYETIEIEAKNLSPSGGTGNYILSDGGVDLHPTNNNNDISINPGDLTPNGALPKSYTLEYYYITQNGCSSDTTEKGFIINPLPVVSFTNTDSVYNIDQGSSIITGLPADAGGRFTSTLESIDDNLDGTAEIDPDIVDLGNQWIKYTYTDANGCLNADTLSVKVNQPLGAISNSSGDFQFCTDGLIETFIGTPNPTDGSPGRFYIDGVPKTTVDNRMSFNPQDYRISVNNEYELKFEYDSATTTYEVYETINIDSIGDISFTGLDLAYCEDEDVDEELTPSTPTGFGGNVNFSGNSITYNVVENLANFNPYVADTGVHVITYTFTRDYSGCQQTFTDTTTVNKTPYVDFDLDKFCVTDKTDSVLFTSDDSTLVSDNVVDWFWRINNSETIRESNVDSSKFSLVPQNNNFASLTLTTDKGCTSFKEKLIFIGSKVDLDFEWDNECDKKTVTFSVTERTDTIGVDRVSWDFGDSFGTVIDTTDNYKPQFGYSGSGGYNVVYNEYTKTCGLISKSKPIVIRPSITIENDGYFEDLEKHPDITGWAVDIIESTSDYSWEWGTPNDSIISSAAGGSLNAFVTNLDDNYKDNEKSYVSSPCFDFSALQKPMISFDFIAELEDGYDGVNLQYSIEKDEWIAVGEINQGVNWYNNSSISALDNRSGWTSTGTDNPLDPTDWRKAKFWIDKLGGKLGVRFRFALKTNGSNSNNNSLEGFGFDNIWIGERNRLVLLEHFANPADVDFESTQAILKNVAEENPRDVIPIQFFTSFPSTSEISNFYTAGPSARSLYYGISQVPYSIIDGGDRKFNYSSTNTLKSTDIQKRMLEDSKFEVKVKQGINGSNLNVQATIRAIDVLEESKLSIRAVIVEKSVDSYMNVVRAMLPDPAGVLFDRSWKKNDSINIFQSWEIPEGVTVDSLITIVYIQNEDSKEIYQTGYTDSFSDDVTSINEDFNNILDIEYVVYPNPTDDILNVKLYKSLTYDLDINIYNNIGALVKSEKLFDGNIQKEININDLPLGIYYLKLGNTDKLFGTKKIIKSN